MRNFEDDLGFSYRLTKSGDVNISHHTKHASVLRAKKAEKFLQEMKTSNIAQQQQIMARLTGNYKRGNEQTAKNHPRNRR